MSTDFVSRDTTHKASKPHRCWYCGERIQVGETYSKRVGVSYGDFWTMRFHDSCEEFAIEHAGYDDQDAYETHDESEFCNAMAEYKAKASGLICIKGGLNHDIRQDPQLLHAPQLRQVEPLRLGAH